MNCIHCGIEINPLRLKALPGARTCVECSTTGPKQGVVATFGEKDHTYNEVVFLEDDQYEKYLRTQKKAKFDKIESEDEESTESIDLNNLEE
jgi:RNA polymerase-binding transcription factor DksA